MHNRLLFVRYVFVFVLNTFLFGLIFWSCLGFCFILVLMFSLDVVLSFRPVFCCILGLGLGLLLLMTFLLLLSLLLPYYI